MEQESKVNILITGVAGFIGSNLADRLLIKGYSVYGVDNLSYGLLEQVPNGVKFYKEDIRSKNLYKLFKKMDVIFHFAAKNCIADCQIDPVETAEINVLGTVNVFDACHKNNIKRVIYAESSAIYEGTKTYPTSEDDESPESFYAVSKYAEKFFAQAFNRFFHMELIALRYFNVYGPRQDYRRSRPPLMSALILNLLQGNKPIIYGDGSKRRDFIHIDDVNNFHELLISKQVLNSKLYNIGSGINYSVTDIYNIIEKVLKTGLQPIFSKDLPGEAFQNLSDNSRACELGWEPKITLEKGIATMIDYIKSNVLNQVSSVHI